MRSSLTQFWSAEVEETIHRSSALAMLIRLRQPLEAHADVIDSGVESDGGVRSTVVELVGSGRPTGRLSRADGRRVPSMAVAVRYQVWSAL